VRSRWVTAAWVVSVAVVLACVVLAIAFVPEWWVNRYGQSDDRSATDRVTEVGGVRQSIILLIGGLVAVIGVYYTHQRHVIERANNQLQQDSNYTDRYTAAVTQLGSKEQTIRLGGIYALERVARDSPGDRTTVEDVLAAFVRADIPRADKELKRLAADETARGEFAAPLDVVAAITVLSRRSETRRVSEKRGDERQEPRINLQGARLGAVNFPDYAVLRDVDLAGAYMRGATLYGADLTGARLHQTDLEGAQLVKAMLTRAHLVRANLTAADLTAAKLSGAHLNQANCRNAVLRDASLQSAYIYDADLAGANLRGADLSDARLTRANLSEANMMKAALVGATLFQAKLAGAAIADAVLTGADLRDADLSRVRMFDPVTAQFMTDAEMKAAHARTKAQLDDAGYWSESTTWPLGYVPSTPSKPRGYSGRLGAKPRPSDSRRRPTPRSVGVGRLSLDLEEGVVLTPGMNLRAFGAFQVHIAELARIERRRVHLHPRRDSPSGTGARDHHHCHATNVPAPEPLAIVADRSADEGSVVSRQWSCTSRLRRVRLRSAPLRHPHPA
jgi:uncharacterized protein YjbI with pentapeptide repeats